MNHEAINRIVCANGYGIGITPNPYVSQCKEWQRRHETAAVRKTITEKINSLFEPRFITPPETAEFIESIITMTESKLILEIGTCTGFTTLHMLRAIIGKPGAKVYSIDCRPAHDMMFFGHSSIFPWFMPIKGETPDVLKRLKDNSFDLVFVDSDHTLAHSERELTALMPITHPGSIFLFHDCPKRENPTSTEDGAIYRWLETKVESGVFKGTIFPTAEQLDCLDTFGPGYSRDLNPHLGVFIRQ